MTQRLTTERPARRLEESDGALAAVRSWPSGKARLWTIDAVAVARQDSAILAIVASGSAVRDVAQSDDLDLALVYRKCRPDLPRPPIGVDLQQHEAAEVPPKLANGHDFLSWAVRFGRPLFERDQWWSRLRADWNDRLSLPSAAEARQAGAPCATAPPGDAVARRSRRGYGELRLNADPPRASNTERCGRPAAFAPRTGGPVAADWRGTTGRPSDGRAGAPVQLGARVSSGNTLAAAVAGSEGLDGAVLGCA